MQLFYRLFAKFYDLLDVTYFKNYEKSPRKALLDAIEGDEKILDLCTGTATNAMNIAKAETGVQMMGVDLSNAMLNVGREKIKKSGLKNITLQQMDATHLKFEDNCFDKVLLSLALHELKKEIASQIIMEAKRVVKPDGEIIVTEWERSTGLVQRLLFVPIHLLEPKPFRSFFKKDLQNYFEKHGLHTYKIKHCSYSQVLFLKK